MPRKPRTTCPHGHDLTVKSNRIVHPSGKFECRICKMERNLIRHRELPLNSSCCECGEPMRPTKAKLCIVCRKWHEMVRHEDEPSASEVEAMLDRAVELESSPEWMKREARKLAQQRMDARRARFAANVRALRGRECDDSG